MKKNTKTQDLSAAAIKRKSPFDILSLSGLILLVFFSTIIRFDAVKKEHPHSFDEALYDYLGTQFKYEPLNYSSSRFFKMVEEGLRPEEERERVRRYVDVPLFKHPPLFSYLIALSKILFGDNVLSSNYVSLAGGIGTIIVIYLLCKNLWGGGWGLLAAFFVAIEPISWLCSQKVWIETTNTFFIYLGILLLYMGQRRKLFLILSGVSLGLSLLLKYPAILAVIPIYLVLLFSDIIHDRKTLFLYILLPFIVGLPWVLWNYNIYGSRWFTEIIKINSSSSNIGDASYNFILKYVLIASVPAFVLAIFFIVKCFFKNIFDKIFSLFKKWSQDIVFGNIWRIGLPLVASIIFIIANESIAKGLNFRYLPSPRPYMNAFNNDPFYFYFYHLIELSPIFLFSYISFYFAKKWDRYLWMMALIVFSFFLFFGLFGFYESRYVTIATPALMVLAVYAAKESLSHFSSQQGLRRIIPIILIISLIIYSAIKTLSIDILIVIKNNFFFF